MAPLRGERPDGRDRDADDEASEHKRETVFVFDWDDTILPTSWLERTHALAGGGELRPKIQQEVANLSATAIQTLCMAEAMGEVMIITNSAPGWVDQSCQHFMPQLCQKVRGYQIVAKPMHSPITFKNGAFQRECRQFSNLVSVGDGEAERSASLRLQASTDRKGGPGLGCEKTPPRRIKSVKLIEMPTCQHLIAQHEMLQVRLADVAAFQGSLDLKARFSSNTFGATGSAAKGAGCALVHFGSLRSLPSGLRGSKSGSQLPELGRTAPSGALAAAAERGEQGDGNQNDAEGERQLRSPESTMRRRGNRGDHLQLQVVSSNPKGEGGGVRASRALLHGAGKKSGMMSMTRSGGASWRDLSAPAGARAFSTTASL